MSRRRPQVDALVEQQLGRSLLVARTRFRDFTARPEFLRDCETRYRIGQAEYHYAYEWLDWTDATFEGQEYTEALDLVVYPTMREVRHMIHGDRL